MRFDMNRPGKGHFGHGFGNSLGRGMGRFGGMMGSRFGGDWGDDDPRGGFFGGGRRGGGHGGGGRGGRGGRMFATGELRLLVLSLLADQDRHGYELIKAIEDLTGGQYAPSPGVVYPTLALLVDEGKIAEVPGEGSRKAFTVTEAGREELAGRGDEATAIADRLRAFAEARGREASPPVMRAMANLKLALRQRVMTKGIDEAAAHQIAEILDEAARRIERL